MNATGVGAVAGVPLNVASAGLIATGQALAWAARRPNYAGFRANALGLLRKDLADRLATYVAVTDDRFRSFTENDSGERMAKIARVDLSGRRWWWFRVPHPGPIAQCAHPVGSAGRSPSHSTADPPHHRSHGR